MKINILLSTYNGEKFLTEQLNSIYQQTIIDDINIIVRDDGSSDNTVKILSSFKNKYDNIYIYEGNNVGCPTSFHKLILQSPMADYYAFCDQDDIWLPRKLEMAIAEIKKLDANIPILYGSRQTIVDQELNEMNVQCKDVSNNLFDIMLRGATIAGCTMVFNNRLREIYMEMQSEIPVNNKSLYYHDSWLMKLAFSVGCVIYDKNSYILYRQHEGNLYGYGQTKFQALIDRIKNFDFTLKKYRDRSNTSTSAKMIIKCYEKYLNLKSRELLYLLSVSKSSIPARIKLLLFHKISYHPIYEYICYKIFIALGWL